jgi:hypothetical protein
MKRTPLTLGIALTAIGVASAQGSPVTVGEANVVLDRIDASVRTVLKMPAAKATADKSQRAVKRSEVIARLDAMFESYRPHFKFTPRPFRTEPSVASKFNPDAKTRASIEKLARWGCIGPVGPLVAGPGDTLTTKQLGDALGMFIAQIAGLTYFADPKWVPKIQSPENSGIGGGP